MLGGIAGDMIGAPYEGGKTPSRKFPLFGAESEFSDDSVCAVAVAEALMTDGDFAACLRRWARRYPDAGYGPGFKAWAFADNAPAPNSYGNGAAMRVAPVGWWARDEVEALDLARASSRASHTHPEAVAGAQAVALAINMLRRGDEAGAVRGAIEARFGWTLPMALNSLPRIEGMDVTAKGTVPPSIACGLAATNWEDAVRAAVMMGGDTDTQACMAGAVAEARFGLPSAVAREAAARLPADLCEVVARFQKALKRRHT